MRREHAAVGRAPACDARALLRDRRRELPVQPPLRLPSGELRRVGVAQPDLTAPGTTFTTCTPNGRSSTRSASVAACTAAFDAQ